jgi:hypothetical protein
MDGGWGTVRRRGEFPCDRTETAVSDPGAGAEPGEGKAAPLLAVAVQAAEAAKEELEGVLSEMWAETRVGRGEPQSRADLNATCNALHLAIPLLRHAQLGGNQSTLPGLLDYLRAWPEADAIDLADELTWANEALLPGDFDRPSGRHARSEHGASTPKSVLRDPLGPSPTGSWVADS